MSMILENISWLVPMAGSLPSVITDVSIRIQEDRVECIVPARSQESPDGINRIDCRGLIALPGLINAHHHLYQTPLRGVGSSGGLRDWFEARLPYLQNLTPGTRFHAIRLALLELIEGGTTTVCEFASNTAQPGQLESTIEALRAAPISIALAYSVVGHQADKAYGILRELEDGPALRRALYIPGPIVPGVSAGSTAGEFRKGVELARLMGIPITSHLLEDPGEAGESQFAFLKDMEALGPKTLLAHAIHLGQTEIAILAESATPVVHNPLSNMRLATGIMPLRELIIAGATVALGTDGGCNDGSNMFETMKVAMGLQRAVHQDARSCTPYDVLKAATIDVARALGLEEVTGSIEEGKRADIILMDPASPEFGVVNDPLAQIVLNGAPSNCRHVIAGGRFVKRDWNVTGMDREETVFQATADLEGFRRRVGDG